MTKKRYSVVIPDVEYYRKIFNCSYACPVHTQAGNYVSAIAEGNYEDAYKIARQPNPFVVVCGRVCGHPCETACRRGLIDEPISIRALKRFATEHHFSLPRKPEAQKCAPTKEKKVAIIGAGPAGLSAAHDLAVKGYSVTVFEKSSEPGGMLFLGLPKYRLPRDVIRQEIDQIINLGVTIKLNKSIGKDFTIEDLKSNGYEAIFLSIGADKSRLINIEGRELDGVLNGIDFLLNINLGYKVELGHKVIIVGGGNVAIDVARSVVREITDIDKMSPDEMKEALKTAQSVFEKFEEVEHRGKGELSMALDVARSAIRLGSKMGIEGIEVKMICLESREEMPAHEEEIMEASGEGINILPSQGPQRIVGKDGKVLGLETIEVLSVFDKTGRFHPTYKEGTNRLIEADTIILAIGQTSDLSFITADDAITITQRGTIQTDPKTMATTASGIYAGGDVAFGPRLIIDAVADGKKAAQAIDEYLQKDTAAHKKSGVMHILPDHAMPKKYDTIGRNEPSSLPLDKRIGIAEVELCYKEDIAKKESQRCLKCDIHTIFDSTKCIFCGGCVDVCPQYCLKMVDLAELHCEEADLYKFVENDSSNDEKTSSATAIIKDEDRCIRCALCAKRCPTKAITMEQFVDEKAY